MKAPLALQDSSEARPSSQRQVTITHTWCLQAADGVATARAAPADHQPSRHAQAPDCCPAPTSEVSWRGEVVWGPNSPVKATCTRCPSSSSCGSRAMRDEKHQTSAARIRRHVCTVLLIIHTRCLRLELSPGCDRSATLALGERLRMNSSSASSKGGRQVAGEVSTRRCSSAL